jgi:DNA processing protein
MSAGQERSPQAGAACARCLRRSWLLSELSGPLEYCARDRGRLFELLALPDRELLAAVAGRRTAELRARYERFPAGELERGHEVGTICRHRRGYPRALSGPAAPPALDVAGGAGRLAKLTAAPVVAILGSRAASDYGIEIARSLARGLAASGVTVAASLTDGIAIAAHAGALDAGGASIAVMGGGLDVSCPARRRSLHERVKRRGCAVSELPRDCNGRRWGQLASERIVVELAALTVLVEAEQTTGDLAAAHMAQALGRPVAAIPGRVTSPLSHGTHALLMDGASLVRGPRDVLELLYRAGASRPEGRAAPAAHAAVEPRAGLEPHAGLASHAGMEPHAGLEPYAGLEPRLKATLARVGAGCDTPDKLTRAGADPAEVLTALSELELMGLLARGDGGRYLPRV